MSQTSTVSASEFKAKCLDIFDRLARHELAEVVITKRGRIVAVVTPPKDAAADIRQLHGFMRGSVVVPPEFDLTAPVLDEAFGAEGGQLHG